VEIRPYTPDLETPVRALNERLRAGGNENGAFQNHTGSFSQGERRNPYQELFVVVHHGEVHGGYIATHSRLALRNENRICRVRAAIEYFEGWLTSSTAWLV